MTTSLRVFFCSFGKVGEPIPMDGFAAQETAVCEPSSSSSSLASEPSDSSSSLASVKEMVDGVAAQETAVCEHSHSSSSLAHCHSSSTLASEPSYSSSSLASEPSHSSSSIIHTLLLQVSNVQEQLLRMLTRHHLPARARRAVPRDIEGTGWYLATCHCSACTSSVQCSQTRKNFQCQEVITGMADSSEDLCHGDLESKTCSLDLHAGLGSRTTSQEGACRLLLKSRHCE